MPWSSDHMKWLTNIKSYKTANNNDIVLLEFNYDETDTVAMSLWAKHFRNHYCLDDEIDKIKPAHMSRSEYLISYKFPGGNAPGPSIQSGDFSEILVSDYLAFTLNYWVPRTRYGSKTIKNESTKGSDVMGFKIVSPGTVSPSDSMIIVESKAQFSGQKPLPRLQVAIDDSIKDSTRIGESLNAIKQRLFDKNLLADANNISRFQDPVGSPYKEEYGAAALFLSSVYDEDEVKKTDSSKHPKAGNLALIVIHGNDMMNLVKRLYKLASDEA